MVDASAKTSWNPSERAANHRQRAVEAMAAHLCSMDYTDGFCSPRDGKCRNPGRRNCMTMADGLMRSMEQRGCQVVWIHDPLLGTTP